MSPKRILHVYLSHLPRCRELCFIDFRKYEPVSNFRLLETGFCIEGA